MHRWGLAVLRVAVGVVFVAHGLPKLIPVWGSSPASAAAMFEAVGLRPAYPLVLTAGGVELVGGLLLLAGAYTIWATLALVASVLVTGWNVHVANGFFLNWTLEPGVGHGYEFDLLLIAALACLMFAGPGALSVDRRRALAAEADAAARARLRASKV